MDKFITSLPRNGNSSSSKNKRKLVQEGVNYALKSRKIVDTSCLKQSFLDLGQKSFGATSSCSKCGMFYVIGDIDDENRHKKYCSKSNEAPTLSLQSMKSFHVLERIDDNECIFELRYNERNKLEQDPLYSIMKVIHDELGSTLTLMEDPSESILLYLRNQKVLGCIAREAIPSHKLIRLSKEKSTVDVDVKLEQKVKAINPKENNDKMKDENTHVANHDKKDQDDSCTSSNKNLRESTSSDDKIEISKPLGDTLGIKLIWVFVNVRREGIASRMIDVARRTFEFGRIIKKEHTSFSQPTEAGLNLFLEYTKKESIWGYC
jgi:hypothetical protein